MQMSFEACRWKIGSSFDQNTCCVISVLSPPEPIWYSCQSGLRHRWMHFLYQAGLKRQAPLTECVPPTIKLHLVSFPFIAAWGRLKPHSHCHWYSESSSRRKSELSNFSLRANLTEGLFYYLCHFWTPPSFLQAPNIVIPVRFFPPHFFAMGASSGQTSRSEILLQGRFFSTLRAEPFSFVMLFCLRVSGISFHTFLRPVTPPSSVWILLLPSVFPKCLSSLKSVHQTFFPRLYSQPTTFHPVSSCLIPYLKSNVFPVRASSLWNLMIDRWNQGQKD